MGEPLTIATASGRRIIGVSLVLGILTTLSLGVVFLMTGSVLDAAMQHHPLSTSTLVVLILSTLSTAICAGLSLFLTHTSAVQEERTLRRTLVRHLLDMGPQPTSRDRTGSTVSLLTDDAERITFFRQTFIGPMIASMLAPAVTLVLIAAAIDWRSAAYMAIVIPFIPLFIGSFEYAFRKVSGKTVSGRWILSAHYLDALQGLTTLRTFRAASRTADELEEIGESHRVTMMKLLFGNQMVILVVDALFSLAMITLAAALSLLALSSGRITVGQAVAMILLSTLMLEPLDRIGQFFYVGMGGLAAQRTARRFLSTSSPYAVADFSSEVNSAKAPADEAKDADAHAAPNPGTDADTASGPAASDLAVVVDGVSFSYQTQEDSTDPGAPLLRSLSLRIENGEHVGIVGPSGGGKSTLAGLLLGDLRPTEGSITIQGDTVGECPTEDIRTHIAAVTQTTWLFTGTLADNLRIARPDATEEEMWKALEDANLAEDIRSMPDGMETEVGERGYALSGGQSQRLAIARALLTDRPILLFDEPTAHVDIASERHILESLSRIGSEKTVIMIAHRPTALRNVHRIFSLTDGVLTPVTDAEEVTHS